MHQRLAPRPRQPGRRHELVIDQLAIGGRMVMKDHKLLTVDEEAAIAKAREYGKKVAASLGMQ